MKFARVYISALSAGLLSVGIASSAAALPLDVDAAPTGGAIIPVVNGYGPNPYGIYGNHRPHHRRSYGTGYHGRGTRTGGPAGGLPSRN